MDEQLGRFHVFFNSISVIIRTNRFFQWSPMQTEKSPPEGKRIMPETRFTEFPALSVDPRVEISRSTSETDVCEFFLPMTLTVISFIFDILCGITSFS